MNQIWSWPQCCRVFFNIPSARLCGFGWIFRKMPFLCSRILFLGKERTWRAGFTRSGPHFPFLAGFWVCLWWEKQDTWSGSVCSSCPWNVFFLRHWNWFVAGVPWPPGLWFGIWDVRKAGLSWTENQDAPSWRALFPLLGWSDPRLPRSGNKSWNPGLVWVGGGFKAH